jgi:hypothetical protein
MTTEKSSKIRPNDSNSNEDNEFLQDLQGHYRHLYALEKQLNALSDGMEATPDCQRLRKDFARVFAEVMTREAFIESLQNGHQILPRRRPLPTA